MSERDIRGRSLVHEAAHRNAVFLLKFLWRMGCDLVAKDASNLLPIEIAAQNNAFRVIQFLNTLSYYPFKTAYVLLNNPSPYSIDFLPEHYEYIEQTYESQRFKEDF